MKLIKIYWTKKGNLRAKIKIDNSVFSIKCGKKTQSLISTNSGGFLCIGIYSDENYVELKEVVTNCNFKVNDKGLFF
jgi:hypothetical protein